MVEFSLYMESNMTNRKQLLGIVGFLIIIILVAGWWYVGKKGGDTAEETAQAVEGDAVDSVIDFYWPLRDALYTAESDPFVYERDNSQELSPEMLDRFEQLKNQSRVAVLEAVICQTSVPEKIKTQRVYELANEVQVIVRARDEGLFGQAIVTLKPHEGRWKISDISCGSGEIAPEREFSFQEAGYLVKSVPPPLNSDYWHVVFKQNGTLGHTVPLFFNESSNCIDASGIESICDPNQFKEASQAMVAGEMSETGLTVQKLEFLK